MENRNARMIVKLAGAAGQGIKTAGLILAKALKRQGLQVFGYTEYPSLIRGGHNVFQIEVYHSEGAPLSGEADILLALDKASIEKHYTEIPDGGVVVYDDNTITLEQELLKTMQEKGISIVAVKLLDLALKSGGNALMKNTVAMGALWEILDLELKDLEPIIAETYNKTPEMVATNLKCLKAGFEYIAAQKLIFKSNIPKAETVKEQMLISGNEAVALGAIAGGVRLYSSYPMTPASSILTYLAEFGPKHGMIVKQAEDEITAANMVIGAYHAGTRAMCATSGGGFDLMTETVSLSGITETPFFCVIGQRPGPGTGVPTWTAQGDLNLALKAGHGEFPRIVIAPSDPGQAFNLTIEGLNLCERYQTPVIMLLDKQLGESFYTVAKFDSNSVTIDRGKIVTTEDFAKDQTITRYKLTDDGISGRWMPGDQISTFYANSDEHTEKGYSTEEADAIGKMQSKRLRKHAAILKEIPDPQVYGDVGKAKLKIVSWGSNIPLILSVMDELRQGGIETALMQITYLWPLKTEKLKEFLNGNTVLIELNATYQLGNLIKSEAGIEFANKYNKVDGRPFYFEEIYNYLSNLVK